MDIRLDVNGQKYLDMLELPRPASRRHPRMEVQDRAAQFAPFAALSGFEEALAKRQYEFLGY